MLKKIFEHIKVKFKSYFFTGLIAIFPFLATVYVLKIIYNFFSANLPINSLKTIDPFLAVLLSYPPITFIISVLLLLIFLIFIGFFVSNIIGQRIFLWWEIFLSKVPGINKIYNGIKQFINSFSFSKGLFKKVVLVQFPKQGTYTIAFVTSDADRIIVGTLNKEFYNIYVPTTPNPTSGYLLIVEKSEVIELDLSIEDAMKLVISMGFYNLTLENQNNE